MLLPVVCADMSPQIRPRLFLLLTIGALKLNVLEVQGLDMVTDHVLEVVDLLAEGALPHGPPVLHGHLAHVLEDGGLQQVWVGWVWAVMASRRACGWRTRGSYL